MEDIKTIVYEKLAASGELDKLKQQIKHKLLEQQENSQEVPKPEVLNSKRGKMCLEIFMNFLDIMKMEYTMSVLIPEAGIEDDETDYALLEEVGLKKDESIPLIFQVVKNYVDRTHRQASDPHNISADSDPRSKLDQLISMESDKNARDPPIFQFQIDEYDYIENSIPRKKK